MSTLVGVLKDRYKIIKMIGQGASSNVYLAEDLQQKRFVAIKQLQVIKENHMEEMRLRFEQEYTLLKEVNDINIIRAYDFFELANKKNLLFMVLEYAEGVSLKNFISRKGSSLSLATKLKMVSHIIRPIETLHKKGIVHRDIKPSNIVVMEEKKLIKLLDLGIAKATDYQSNLTQEGAIIGTIDYMSPEQIEGKHSFHSDIFSLGVVLYQFFLDLESSPFSKGNPVTTMHSICSEELPLLVEVKETLAHEKNAFDKISQIIQRTLAKNVAQRSITTTELCYLLQEVYTSLPQKTVDKWNYHFLKNKQQQKSASLTTKEKIPKKQINTLKHTSRIKSSKNLRKTLRVQKKKSPNYSAYAIAILLVFFTVLLLIPSRNARENGYQKAREFSEMGNFERAHLLYQEIFFEHGDKLEIQEEMIFNMERWIEKTTSDKNEKELQEILVYLSHVTDSQKFPNEKQQMLNFFKNNIDNTISKWQEQKKSQEVSLKKSHFSEEKKVELQENKWEEKLSTFLSSIASQNPLERWQTLEFFAIKNGEQQDLIGLVIKEQQKIEKELYLHVQSIHSELKNNKESQHWLLEKENWKIFSKKIAMKEEKLSVMAQNIDNLIVTKTLQTLEINEAEQEKVENLQQQWNLFRNQNFFAIIKKRNFDLALKKCDEFLNHEPKISMENEIKQTIKEINHFKKIIFITQKNIKKMQGKTISLALLNGKYIRGRITSPTPTKFTLIDYKNSKHDILYNELKAKEYINLAPEKKYYIAILLLSEDELEMSERILKESDSPGKTFYLHIIKKITEEKNEAQNYLQIFTPQELAKTSAYAMDIPSASWYISISGRVNKYVEDITIQGESISWDQNSGKFNKNIEIKYGDNNLSLKVKLKNSQELIRHWRVKRAFPENITTHRGNWERTGYYQTKEMPKLREKKWSFYTSGFITGSPVIADGIIYFVNGIGEIYALDKEKGDKIWSYKTVDSTYSEPTIHEGILYIGASDNTLYAFNAKNGQLLWRFYASRRILGAPAIHNNTLYFGAEALYALDAKTGKLIWERPIKVYYASPVISENKMFIAASGDSILYCLDLKNGDIIWKFKFLGYYSKGCTVYKNRVFLGDEEGNFYAVDIKNGKELWKLTTEKITTYPAAHNDTIYFGSRNGALHAVDYATGTIKWKYTTTKTISSSPIISGDYIYFGSSNGYLYAVNNQGQLAWQYNTKDQITSSPLIENGVVYFGSYNKIFYALH